MSQKDESQMEVFLYDKGELPDQSEQFKGRVSHFPNGLEQGNASITIRNITRADSGDYRCSFPFIQKHQKFHIKLVVDPKVIKVREGSDVTLPCSLRTKEDLRLTWFVWEKTDDDQKVFLYDKGDLYSDERPGQSEQFKGRVSHFPDELEQGNASIIIRNTRRADSGVYRCIIPLNEKPEMFYIKLDVEPKLIRVREGSDVTLPCSLITKEDLRLTRFIWKKVSQKTDDGQKVFLYDKGDLYSDERPGQSEQFKGRVSHFPDELEQGNASIIIRNTTRADSGDYRCSVPFIQKPQEFHIYLVVEPKLIRVREGSDVTLPCSLITKEDITSTRFVWEKTYDDQAVFLCDKGDLYSDELPDQSELFKGRVSHFPDELEQGNASIIIRNTTWADTGLYSCIIKSIQKRQIFHIYLVVGPKVIKVREGRDVTLPSSLITKEDLRLTWFVWEKTDGGQKVFQYDNGDLYSDERPGQSEQFKGRVSHFSDELEQGNASIIIRNTTRADSGDYRCSVPFIQKPQEFHIKLVVEPKLIVEEGSDVTLPCSLITKEDLRLTRFIWQKVSQTTDDNQEVFLYDKGDLYSDERPGQSEQFKGRVSHFPDELKQGNASIIIRNTTRADSGDYRCSVPLNEKPEMFYMKLDVGPTPEPDELHPLMKK
ncbi:CD276 antigen-like isoform X1 [Sander vitreus]